jgi:hypothetical protein
MWQKSEALADGSDAGRASMDEHGRACKALAIKARWASLGFVGPKSPDEFIYDLRTHGADGGCGRILTVLYRAVPQWRDGLQTRAPEAAEPVLGAPANGHAGYRRTAMPPALRPKEVRASMGLIGGFGARPQWRDRRKNSH